MAFFPQTNRALPKADQSTNNPKTTFAIDKKRLIDMLLRNGSRTAAHVIAVLLEQNRLDWHEFGTILRNALRVNSGNQSRKNTYHGCPWVTNFLADILISRMRNVELKGVYFMNYLSCLVVVQ